MPGKPITDLCPGCGIGGGEFHDWFPELGDRDEWPCGTVRGIDRHTGQRIAYTSNVCNLIRDLKRELAALRSNQGGADHA